MSRFNSGQNGIGAGFELEAIGAVLLVQISLRVPVRAANPIRTPATRMRVSDADSTRPPRVSSERPTRLTLGSE